MDSLHQKQACLQKILKGLNRVAIAYSGGVDSTFLLAAAAQALPKEDILAITIVSPFTPNREKQEAERFCAGRGITHRFLRIDILSGDVARNPKNRCYLCKKILFKKMLSVAAESGIQNVAEGSNLDDTKDYRPGLQAVAELGIKSPLRAANLTKQDIRDLSKEMELPTWDKPAFACLATRFVYGEPITAEKLQMVDKAEQFLSDLGFKQYRVRIHKNMARIEVLPGAMPQILRLKDQIHTAFARLGFDYVALDLQGYRTGSMNKPIL